MAASQPSGGEVDYFYDISNEYYETGNLIYSNAIDSAREAFDRMYQTGEQCVVRVKTIYGTWDFYDFEDGRRIIESYSYNNIGVSNRNPEYCEIDTDGVISIYFML